MTDEVGHSVLYADRLRRLIQSTVVAILAELTLGLGVSDASPSATSTGSSNERADLRDQISSDSEDSQTTSIQEIVVTAERREQPLDRVPESLTVLSQKTMDDLHVESFSDLATIVPGLALAPPQVYTQAQTDVAIRGIYSGGNAPTTAIYIDETPIEIRRMDNAAISGSPLPEIFDLERIEVLRGPQGTLFGSSAMGGAIRYVTRQPSLEVSSGYARAEVSYTERGAPNYALGVAYGAPIVEGVAASRVSGDFHSDGGYVDIEDPYTGTIVNRNVNSSHSYTLRAALTIAPTGALTIMPALFIEQMHSDGPAIYWTSLLPNLDGGAAASGNLAAQPVNDRLTVPSLAIRYDFSKMRLESDTSYVGRDYVDDDDWTNLEPVLLGGVPLNPAISGYTFRDTNIDFTRAWQQEFRLTSDATDARINWVVGAYYRRALEGASQLARPDLSPVTELLAHETSAQFFGVPSYALKGASYAGYTYFTTVDEQKALFGLLWFKISRRLQAEVGVRVEHAVVEKQFETYAGPLNGSGYTSKLLPDESQNPVTPRLSLTYLYTDALMVYATAAKGYRAGGSNALNATTDAQCQPSLQALGLTSVQQQYSSDRLWSYEIGAKDSFFGHALVMQASVFYIDWTAIQTQLALPSCGLSFYTNSGRAISRGFDLQIAAIPIEGLKLSFNAAYTDAYYPNASYGAPINGVAPVQIGAGDKVPNVVPWTATATAEYSWNTGHLWEGARAYCRADYRWLDQEPKAHPNVVGYDSQTGQSPNQAYSLLNLRLGMLQEGLDLSIFVNNAMRSHPLIGYDNIFYGNPLFEAAAIRPMTAGVTALYRF